MLEVDDLEAFAEAADVLAGGDMIGLHPVALHRGHIREGPHQPKIQCLLRAYVLPEIIPLDFRPFLFPVSSVFPTARTNRAA